MKIAVLSGKGGAGKTLVAVNLAAAAGQATYIDCDVEAPNGRLFFRPQRCTETTVTTPLPAFDTARCNGCRKCVDFCRFHALVYIKGSPRVFPEVCHACGGCAMVCPVQAITETARPVGVVESGWHGGVHVVTGVLSPGEASGIPVIHAALTDGVADGGLCVIDCPPGSACAVSESVSGADYCVLVAEPSAFGFHNFRMVCELVTLLQKPCGVVINKQLAPYAPLEDFCAETGLPILLRLPYTPALAQKTAAGEIACEADEELRRTFSELLGKIGGAFV